MDGNKKVQQVQKGIPKQQKLRQPHGVEVQVPQAPAEATEDLPRPANTDREVPGGQIAGESADELVDSSPAVIVGKSGPSAAGWSSVEAGWRCAKEYQLGHIRGIRKPQNVLPSAFSIGSGFHAGRAKWFGSKFRTDEATWNAIRDAVRIELEDQRLPSTLKSEQMTLAFLGEYIEYWSKRAKPTPVATEYLLGPAPLEPNHPFYFHRTARLDDVSRYPEAGNLLAIGESKTTSAGISDCINQYTLHGQTLLQLILWKLAPQGEAKLGPVAGVVLDITQKGYGGTRSKFHREFLPITDRSIQWYIANMSRFLAGLQKIDWDTDAPRNITACTRIVGRGRIACDFRDLCMHGRSASIKYVLRDGSSLLTWKQSEGQTVSPWE